MSKFEAAKNFIWFHTCHLNHYGLTVSQINEYFQSVNLNKANPSRLKDELNKSREITRNTSDEYTLSFGAREILNAKYTKFTTDSTEIPARADLYMSPFLSNEDINDAKKMAQLYQILHCFENSVRNYISNTLEREIGEDWWEKVKNSELERKVRDRKEKEMKQRWVSNRGATSPLFYLDWGDLVKIIRNHEGKFTMTIPNIKFVEHRLEELELLRNIIAHNGKLPSDNDIDRIVVHFNDWCKQLKEIS